MKQALVNGALLLGSAMLSLCVIEAALRIRNPFYQRVRFGTIVLPKNCIEKIRNDRVPGLPSIVVKRRNSLGFRGPEPPAPFDRYLSIITVGGSTTEASYEPEGLTWTDRLAARLAGCFTDVWVNNAGFDGHTTFGHLALMRDHLARLRPKIAMFLVGANDRWVEEPSLWDQEIGVGNVSVANLTALGKSVAARLETCAVALNLYRSFRAWREGAWYTQIAWESIPEGEVYPPHAAAELAMHRTRRIPAYRKRLHMLAVLTRDAGILPIFITQPIVFGDARDPATGKDLRRLSYGGFEMERMQLYNDALQEVAAEEHVPLIDLARKMPHNTQLFFDPVHYTSRGEETVAEILDREAGAVLAAHFTAHLRPECKECDRASYGGEPSR